MDVWLLSGGKDDCPAASTLFSGRIFRPGGGIGLGWDTSMNHRSISPLAVMAVASILAVVSAGSGHAVENEVSLITKKPVGELAVAGRLSVDLHARFMLSRSYGSETAMNWYNCGYSGGGGGGTEVGGNFGDFGLQVPAGEREAKYPRAVLVGEVPAVAFDGNDWMKGNFPAEPGVSGQEDMAVEIWLRVSKPVPGMIIAGWQSPDGRQSSAPIAWPDAAGGSDTWRHLVVNAKAGGESWYLDGKKLRDGPRATVIGAGHLMVLGGATSATPSFTGELAAVRLHDAAMTEAEILHNHAGGVMLGTKLHAWWNTGDDGKWWIQESGHFRHAVEKDRMAKWNERERAEFEARLPGMFHLAELVHRTYTERLAMRSSVVSRRKEMRGDGIKYTIPIQTTDGGNYMGVDDDFGWACQAAGFINPHELVHGLQAQTGGMQGNYWETHANFPQTYNGIYQTMPIVTAEGPSAPSSGRTYYHDRLFFEHTAQSPEYGPMFISKLWYDGPTAEEKNPCPWQTFVRLDPDPTTPLGHEYVRMVQKMITWDYQTFAEAKPGNGNTPHGNDGVPSPANRYREAADAQKEDLLRFARILLEPMPGQPSEWRVPKHQAPQQLGWNICPLEFSSPGTVTARLTGYVNPERGSDWRAGFVAVTRGGQPVYGDVFAPGADQSFTIGEDIQELYLVVCAVPTKLMTIDMTGDFRSFEQEPFPYRVKLTGCQPKNLLALDAPPEGGAAHPNGGGFVASSARAEASAFIGPDARVLGNSRVLGQARIDGRAVVRDSTVRDHALVTGHALVTEESTVGGYAVVGGFAMIKNRSVVQDRATVLEHAMISSGKTCGGDVTVKGLANVYGGNQKGTAMLDGFYAKGNEIDKGKWFTWSWGQGKNPGEVDTDFGGVYLDMGFESPHPWMARDDFGATWGYLVGQPAFAPDPAAIRSVETLLQPADTLASLESIVHVEHHATLLTGYLTPPATGEYTFHIAGDDEAEIRLGAAGETTADRTICSNPFFAHANPPDFTRFPSQKSEPVTLEKGEIYPIQILHANGHMGSGVTAAWSVPGSSTPEIIRTPHLSVTPDGKSPGITRRVWGEVTSIADLIKRPDFPGGARQVAGTTLVLDGASQYVELPRDITMMRDITLKARIRWQGGDNQRLFSFSGSPGNSMAFSPSAKGKARFVIAKDGKFQQLVGPPVPRDTWTEVTITLQGDTGVLSLNGQQVARNPAMTFDPVDIAADQCYLGRGPDGNFFRGRIDSFRIEKPAARP